jgi:hypothetical protein
MSERAKMADMPDCKAERRKLMTAAMMNPATAHAAIAHALLKPISGDDLDQEELTLGVHERLKAVRAGKLGSVHNMLAAQAFSLDALYAEMMRRAMLNLGEYPDAVERYMRLALKAQAQSRATLEALAKMHQPREQTVRHVHVDNRGGQAVIAETIQTGGQNGNAVGQSHATGAAGIGAALPRPDAIGWGVPSPGSEGPEAVPDARRDKSGGA